MNDQQIGKKRLVWLAIGLSLCVIMVPTMSAGPESAIALLQEQAVNSLEAGNMDDAERALERALRLDSKNPTTWELSANLRSNQGLAEQASMMTLKAESLRRDRTSQLDSGRIPEIDLSNLPEVMAIPDEQMVGPDDEVPTLEEHWQHYNNHSESTQNRGQDNSRDSYSTENERRNHSNSTRSHPWIDESEFSQDRQRYTTDNSLTPKSRQRSNYSSQPYNIRPGFTESIIQLDNGRKIYTYRLTDSESLWDTECGYPKCRQYNQSSRERRVQDRRRDYDDNGRHDPIY